jgi:Ca2+-binding RTX toxin-like protein
MGVTGGQATRKTAATTRPQGRPQLESLEDRQLLSGMPPVQVSAHTMSIFGTSGPDHVSVYGNSGSISCWFNGQSFHFSGMQVTRVFFYGGDGADHFNNGSSVSSWAWGGGGDDVLTAGQGTDISPGVANDNFFGEGGNDYLRGGAGADYLDGGDNQDTLIGDAGNDYLDGGQGRVPNGSTSADGYHDYLYGGSGADTFVQEEINSVAWGFLANVDPPVDFNLAQGDKLLWS